MSVLAIDPGPAQSAFVLWDNGKLRAFDVSSPNDRLRDGILSWNLAPVAIEMIASYGMAVGKEVFETCVWIGRFCERSPVEPLLVYRRDIKLHHCGTNRAKDANIRQVLIDKYGAPGTKKNPGATYGLKSHLWAAFALATYISETQEERGASCSLTTTAANS